MPQKCGPPSARQVHDPVDRKDQIRSPDRTTCFLASDRACTNQQHLSWLCILFLSSPKQVCAPSTQMGEAQEAEDEEASPRPHRYPRSRYRPDGARRRTAGELRARGARNQWTQSTSQNRRGADNRPLDQQARDRTQSRQPCAQANQWRHRGQARTTIATTAGEIGTVDPGMARLDSRLKNTEALPTLKRSGERQLRAAAHNSPLSRSAPLR